MNIFLDIFNHLTNCIVVNWDLKKDYLMAVDIGSNVEPLGISECGVLGAKRTHNGTAKY